MPQVNLLRSLPKATRNTDERSAKKNPHVVATAKMFGQQYFDGPREYGYGGYKQDGRWHPVASEIIDFYNLGAGSPVLDVGCAKGFLVDAFLQADWIEAFGLDVSWYALQQCPKNIVGRLHLGSATCLPFPDKSFDLVVSLNTLHNLARPGVVQALREIMRVSKGKAFVQVDSYTTPAQKAIFEDWVLTAEFHDYPDGWLKVFDEAGYTGDYDWTIIE